jgi:hypothetical protein
MMTTGIVKNNNNPWWQKRKEKEQGFARTVPLKMIPFFRFEFPKVVFPLQSRGQCRGKVHKVMPLLVAEATATHRTRARSRF